jgi:7-carboxy-7-deazaguanine synthase
MDHRRDWLLVSETFFTLQGEGPSTGKPAFFVRLGACNLHCRWCDTPYTWAFDKRHADMHNRGQTYDPQKELTRIEIARMAAMIREQHAPLVVITGGEPLLQAQALDDLIALLNENSWIPIEIETAGTISPGPLTKYENVHFNVSPKLASSGNPYGLRFNHAVLRELLDTQRAIFKFVCDTSDRDVYRTIREDITEILGIARKVDIPHNRIWLMPQGTTEAQITSGLRILAPHAIDNRFNLTGRMHVVIWGDKRGR